MRNAFAGNTPVSEREPFTAAALSLIPGLGQLYNGEHRKGMLFLDVSAINFVLLWVILFAQPIAAFLRHFGKAFEMRVNGEVIAAIEKLHFGSPLSIIFIVMFAAFAIYSMRDAYDHAAYAIRKHLYPDAVIEMPEAASGSYLLHFAFMLACVVVASFFIVPHKNVIQETEIILVTDKDQLIKPPLVKNKIAEHNVEARGRSTPDKPVNHAFSRPQTEKANSVEKNPPSQPHTVSQPPAVSQPRQVSQPPAASQPPAPPAPPVPQPLAPSLARSTPNPLAALSKAVQPSNPTAMPQPMMMPQPAMPKVSTSGNPNPLIASAVLPRGNQAALPAPGNMTLGKSSFTPQLPAELGHASNAGPSAVSPGPVASTTKNGRDGSVPTPMQSGRKQQEQGTTDGTGPGPKPTRLGPGTRGNDDMKLAALPQGRPTEASTPRDDGGKFNAKNNDRTGHDPDTGVAAPDFGPYMTALQRRIKRGWFPPKIPTSNRTIVRFNISRDGELSGLRISKSSGDAMTDKAALSAVENAAPLPHLPAGSPESVDVEFTFDFNVFGGGGTQTLRHRQF